ncbi:MAG: Gfo/Idh/MocA family oxidoreductase [Planctomycetota bacterium]
MTATDWTRREMLKAAGAAGSALFWPVGAAAQEATTDARELGTPATYEWKKPSRALTAIVIGAGGRGNVYASYARGQPEEWRIAGVAEPLRHRNERMAGAYGIPEANRFATWQHVFDRPKFADVCLITTPDHLHYAPAMMALERGYDLLLEKAIAQSWRECKDILRLAQRKGAIVGIGHVLRYAPFFRQMHHIVQAGRIGKLASVQHLEPVEHVHMSHSFVRGNWRNATESNPMLLSKSCHDLDILRWIIGKPCRKVQSFGSLALFRNEMAPPGAPARCTEGCPVESTCPFSALRIYLREHLWGTHHLAIPDDSPESIMTALRQGPYGKCVYHNDNDVVDHQVVNMEFEGGATAAFSMEGLTSYGGRRTRITGTEGDIAGDERTLDVFEFSTRRRYRWDVTQHAGALGGHGGGDHGLVRDFVQAVSRRDPSLLTSSLEAAMESHLIAFKAEESRAKGGQVIEVDISTM